MKRYALTSFSLLVAAAGCIEPSAPAGLDEESALELSAKAALPREAAEHPCLHAKFGPHVETTVDVSRAHTHYLVTLDAQGRASLTLSARRAGTYAMYVPRAVRLAGPRSLNGYATTACRTVDGGQAQEQFSKAWVGSLVAGENRLSLQGEPGARVGFIAEALSTATFYRDQDADGYGDPNASVAGLVMPAGYVDNDLDCDDANPANFGENEFVPAFAEAVEHGCLHALHGPYNTSTQGVALAATMSLPGDANDVGRAHTMYQPLTLAPFMGAFGGSVRYVAREAGVYAFMASAPSMFIESLKEGQLTPVSAMAGYATSECGEVRRSTAFTLEAGVTYVVSLYGNASAAGALLVEHVEVEENHDHNANHNANHDADHDADHGPLEVDLDAYAVCHAE